jgi:pimeloyl-ACP methyl ester carboxylesterase
MRLESHTTDPARVYAAASQQLGAVDRGFFSLNPLGRRVAAAARDYVARHGRIGEGALPVVVIPGFLNDATDLRAMRYFLRELGFPTEIVKTKLRSTASVFGDARDAADVGERLMRTHGTDGYVLMGYSRGGLGIEAMRTSMPERFRNVASAIYLDSPITRPEPGTSGRALKAIGIVSDAIASGARELRRDPSIWQGWIQSRTEGLRAAQAARTDFRAIAFQAPRQDVVAHRLSMLPQVTGVTSNVVARGSGGHLIGLGLDVTANTHLAELIAALPTNRR